MDPATINFGPAPYESKSSAWQEAGRFGAGSGYDTALPYSTAHAPVPLLNLGRYSGTCCNRITMVCSRAMGFLKKHPLTTAGCIALIGIVTYFNPLAGGILLLTATTALVAYSILKVCQRERHMARLAAEDFHEYQGGPADLPFTSFAAQNEMKSHSVSHAASGSEIFDDGEIIPSPTSGQPDPFDPAEDEADETVLFDAAQQNGSLLQFASPALLNDKTLVQAAVSMGLESKTAATSAAGQPKTSETLPKYKGPNVAYFDDFPDLNAVISKLGHYDIHEFPMLEITYKMVATGILPGDMEAPVMAGVINGKPAIAVKFDVKNSSGSKQIVITFIEKEKHISVTSTNDEFNHGNFKLTDDPNDIHLAHLQGCAQSGFFKCNEYMLTFAKPKTVMPVILD